MTKLIISPKVFFWLCNMVAAGLLFFSWLYSGEQSAFFLLLFLLCTTLFRWRLPGFWQTVTIDAIVLLMFDQYIIFVIILLSEIFYRMWQAERTKGLQQRDAQAGKLYQFEDMQASLTEAVAQVERMSIVSERTRISRDIHDNAGHEIVAAFISFQTIRNLLDGQDAETLELYDAALERLDAGMNKIRESVHNLSAVTELGVSRLRNICETFPKCPVKMQVHGDTETVAIYIWNMLESCLRECLTNAARHSKCTYVSVSLDVTPHIVRLCVENDGVSSSSKAHGSGLRNLRHRTAAIGGSLSVDAGKVFRVVCVIPCER